MEKLEYEIEFITPAFIGGADQKAELRPASFMGLLRWWWRILKGWNNARVKELYEEEAEVFGGAGERSKAGRIWLRLKPKHLTSGNDLQRDFGIKWWFDREVRSLAGPYAGIGYLFFSAYMQKRDYLKPQSAFVLEIIGEEKYLQQAEVSLWALATLGGVGTRSRRGGGNINIVRYTKRNMNFIPREPVKDWFAAQYEKALDILKGNSLIECVYISKKPFTKWQDALNSIGEEFMEFRRKNKNRIFEMGAFGLPIGHGSKGKKVFLKPEKHNRRASPLIFKLLKTEKGHRWLIIRVGGPFLPEGEKLRLNKEKEEVDLGILDEFMDTIKNKAERLV